MIKRDDFRRGIGKLIENLIRGISVRSTPRVSSRDEKRRREGRRGRRFAFYNRFPFVVALRKHRKTELIASFVLRSTSSSQERERRRKKGREKGGKVQGVRLVDSWLVSREENSNGRFCKRKGGGGRLKEIRRRREGLCVRREIVGEGESDYSSMTTSPPRRIAPSRLTGLRGSVPRWFISCRNAGPTSRVLPSFLRSRQLSFLPSPSVYIPPQTWRE